MATIITADSKKSVAEPNSEYLSIKDTWIKNRAICSGEKFVKEYDGLLDNFTFSNLLIPFSPSMTPQQYNFYKAEAELPGLVSLYLKFVVGGLLRKQPILELSDDIPDKFKKEIKEWIITQFTQDGLPLSSFLNEVLTEEIQTARCWILVDYPKIESVDTLTQADFNNIRPFPILLQAENVINWRIKSGSNGRQYLDRLIVRKYEESYEKNEFHSELIDKVYVHEVVNGKYQIRVFRSKTPTSVIVVNGKLQYDFDKNNSKFELEDTITNILMNGESLSYIPAWPANGSISISESLITPLVDREVGLYNKISRRNHLLYGASTYTPVISDDMSDEAFQDIVDAGLGSWIKLSTTGTASVLDTPTDALVDMDRAIAASIEEMAKMGIRMLAPESVESGIALEIRNAAQTATLGTLNLKISNTFKGIIAFMIMWRFNIELKENDINFGLSSDFNPSPLGADWLRLTTEWYQQGLIPRSVWLQIIKQNDIVSADYNDEEAIQEINSDEFIMPNTPGRMEANAAIQGNAQKVSMEASGLDNIEKQN